MPYYSYFYICCIVMKYEGWTREPPACFKYKMSSSFSTDWKHPSVTEQWNPTQWIFPFTQWKFSFPSTWMKFLNLPCQVVASPVRLLHTQHVSFVYVWKRQNSDLTETGNLVGNFPTRTRVRIFPKTRWEYRCHWVCYWGVLESNFRKEFHFHL